jgi:ankyrin repeat protein
VYCQQVYLRGCHPARLQQALAELPETLDETYSRTLRQINNAHWDLAHRLFQCVAVASRPLRVEELAEFLAFEFKEEPIPGFHEDWRSEDPLDAVLSICSSLLSVVNENDSSVIQFSHFSVKEFLMSDRLAKTNDKISRRYHISLTSAHTVVAQACLGILLHLDASVTEGSPEKFPLAEYAAEHWVDHARFEDVSAKRGRRDETAVRPEQTTSWDLVMDIRPRIAFVEAKKTVRKVIDTQRNGVALRSSLRLRENCGIPGDRALTGRALSGVPGVDCIACGVAQGTCRSRSDTSRVGRRSDSTGQGRQDTIALCVGEGKCGRHSEASREGRRFDSTGQARQDTIALCVAEGKCGRHSDASRAGRRSDSTGQGRQDTIALCVAEGKCGRHSDTSREGRRSDSTGQGRQDTIALCVAEGKCGRHSDASRAGRRSDSTGQGRPDTIALCVAVGKCGRHSDTSREGRRSDSTGQGRQDTIALCVAEGNVEGIRMLLEKGADPTAQDKDGKTPLHFASQREMWKAFGCFSRRAQIRQHRTRTARHHCTLRRRGKCGRHSDASREGRRSDSTGQGRQDTIALCVAEGKCGRHSDASREGRRSDSTGQGRQDTIALCVAEGNVEGIRMLLEKGADPTAQDKDGKTPLHFASHLEMWKAFGCFSSGAQIRQHRTRTARHHCTLRWRERNVEGIRMLLERGADPTAQDKDGKTPLHFASQREMWKAFGCFSRRAQIRQHRTRTARHHCTLRRRGEMWKAFGCFSRRAQIRQHRTRTARHHCTLRRRGKCGSHSDASREGRRSDSTGQGRQDTIALCVAEGKCGRHSDASREGRRSNSTGQGRQDTIALCVAVGKCGSHSDASREGRRSDSTGQGRQDTIALCVAVGKCGRHSDLLLERGADPTAQDKDGKTPLHFASRVEEMWKAFGCFSRRAQIRQRRTGRQDTIALCVGVSGRHHCKCGRHSDASRAGRRSDSTGQGRQDTIALCVEVGKCGSHSNASRAGRRSDSTGQGRQDTIALCVAVGKCGRHSDASRAGRRSDSTGQGRQDTIALCVAEKENVEGIRMLLERGADPTAQDKDGKTPLHSASQRGNVEGIRMLLEKGADPTAQDKDGKTPLHFASQEGNVEGIRMLLERGADPTAQDKDGKTPLHFASERENVEGIRMLLEKGADPTAQDKDGKTPLHFASEGECGQHSDASRAGRRSDSTGQGWHDTIALLLSEWGNVEAIRMLLEKGADPTAQDKVGKTPLHFALQKGNVEGIRMLLEKGADPTAQDKDGKTPLHFALQKGNVEGIRMLLEKGADPTAQDKDGKTPLHFASQREMWKAFGCFSRRAQIRQHRTMTARHHCTLCCRREMWKAFGSFSSGAQIRQHRTRTA